MDFPRFHGFLVVQETVDQDEFVVGVTEVTETCDCMSCALLRALGVAYCGHIKIEAAPQGEDSLRAQARLRGSETG